MLEIDTDWQYLRFTGRAAWRTTCCASTCYPSLGAKIYNFVHKPSGSPTCCGTIPTLPPARPH